MSTLFPVIGILFLCVSCAAGRPEEQSERTNTKPISGEAFKECSPAYLELPSEVAEVKSGAWSFSMSFLLIGCRQELSSLTAAERSDVLDLLVDYSREKGLYLLAVNDDYSNRRDAIDAINDELDRLAASDIYFHLRSAGEEM